MAATETTPDGRSSRWDGHRLARREELVEATLHAIREHGARVGMEEVAATARTSKTVFYRHFTDRAGLYLAVADRVDATIIRDLTRAAGDPAPTDARAVIRAVIAAYLRQQQREDRQHRAERRACGVVERVVVHEPVRDRTQQVARARIRRGA